MHPQDLRDAFSREFGIDYFDPALSAAVEAVGRYRDRCREEHSSRSLREEIAVAIRAAGVLSSKSDEIREEE